jgi:hypothetical protein
VKIPTTGKIYTSVVQGEKREVRRGKKAKTDALITY